MTELLELIVGQIVGNIATVLFGVLLYYNFLLFEDYFRLIVWAFLLSQALRGAKENVTHFIENLCEDPERGNQPLLHAIGATVYNYVVNQTTRQRRTIKLFLLDHGIFIFAIVGAISIILRVCTWIEFLGFAIIASLVSAGALWLIDRRVFYYRYFISDQVLVSTLLIIGMFTTATFVVLYLGTESFMEGSKAAADISEWVQERVINDETTRRIWSEQVTNGKAMISSALLQVEETYNDTMWFPPIKNIVVEYYNDDHETGLGVVASSLRSNVTLHSALMTLKDRFHSFNLTSAQLSDWSSTGLGLSTMAFGSVAQLIVFLVTVLIAFISLGIRAVFFVTSLFYLLCAQVDPVERFVNDLLPIEVAKKPAVLKSLRRAIEGVFFLPVKISSLHAIVTLISYNALEAEFLYLATFLTFAISVVPIIPPFLVCVPWAITISIRVSLVRGLALFLIHYLAFAVIDDALYEKSLGTVNSYVSALSVVFGVYVFGFEGVIFGPLLICGVSFAYELSGQSIQATQDDLTSPGRKKMKRKATSSEFDSTSTGSIFSNAYRVISGDGSFFSQRRLSLDSNATGSVSLSLLLEGFENKRYRFVASKEWTHDEFIDAIERSLRISCIEGVYSHEGDEILSVSHIISNEILTVRLHDADALASLLPQIRSPQSPAPQRRRRRSTRPYMQRTRVSSRMRRSPLKKILTPKRKKNIYDQPPDTFFGNFRLSRLDQDETRSFRAISSPIVMETTRSSDSPTEDTLVD